MTLFNNVPFNWHYPLQWPLRLKFRGKGVSFSEMHFGEQKEGVGEHSHLHFESVFFIEGKGRYSYRSLETLEERTFDFGPGMLFTAAPGCVHWFRIHSKARLIFWNWGLWGSGAGAEIGEFERGNDTAGRIAACLHLIGQEGLASDRHSSEEMGRLLRSLFLNMERLCTPWPEKGEALMRRVPQNTRIREILLFMRRSFHRPLRLGELAAQFGMSGRHLIRVFKAQTPPLRFSDTMNRIRVEAACQMIGRHPDWPLSKIYSGCGFCDEYYFGKIFKKVMAVPPGHYRTGLRTSQENKGRPSFRKTANR